LKQTDTAELDRLRADVRGDWGRKKGSNDQATRLTKRRKKEKMHGEAHSCGAIGGPLQSGVGE